MARRRLRNFLLRPTYAQRAFIVSAFFVVSSLTLTWINPSTDMILWLAVSVAMSAYFVWKGLTSPFRHSVTEPPFKDMPLNLLEIAVYGAGAALCLLGPFLWPSLVQALPLFVLFFIFYSVRRREA